MKILILKDEELLLINAGLDIPPAAIREITLHAPDFVAEKLAQM